MNKQVISLIIFVKSTISQRHTCLHFKVDFHCRLIFTCVHLHVDFRRVNKIEAM